MERRLGISSRGLSAFPRSPEKATKTPSAYMAESRHIVVTRENRARYLQDEVTRRVGGSFSFLDIGGSNFFRFCQQNGHAYTSLDLPRPMAVGDGGWYKKDFTITYDGRNFPFKKGTTFDVINMGFMLHHASQNTMEILKQVKVLRPKLVIVGEDLLDLDHSLKWMERCYQHQPGGMFRSDREWVQLFRLLGFRLLKTVVISRPQEDSLYGNPDLWYRAMYFLSL